MPPWPGGRDGSRWARRAASQASTSAGSDERGQYDNGDRTSWAASNTSKGPVFAYPTQRPQGSIADTLTHTHPKVKAWLAKHPRVHLHFTPTSASWMNLVEVFFSIITRQAIRRGSFASVGDLVAAIRRFVDGWNERSQPFVWVKDADDIMIKATRKRTSGTEH